MGSSMHNYGSPIKPVDFRFPAPTAREDMIIHLFAVPRWFDQRERHIRTAFGAGNLRRNRAW